MVITSKRGNLDNVVTYEHICDFTADMADIDSHYITLGSVCTVINGEGGLELYIADSEKQWHPIMAGGNNDSNINLNLIINKLQNKVTANVYNDIIGNNDINNISNDMKIDIINNLIENITTQKNTSGNFTLYEKDSDNNTIQYIIQERFFTSEIESLQLPDTILQIAPSNTFKGSKIKSLTGNNVEIISAGALAGCQQLETVNFKNLLTIEAGSFNSCSNLLIPNLNIIWHPYEHESFKLSKDIKIGDYAFSGIKGINHVYIKGDNNTIQIGEGAFAQFNTLKDVIILNENTNGINSSSFLYSNSFVNCTGLEKVILDLNISAINGSFSGATNLKYLYLGPTIKSIDNYSFSGAPITCKIRCGCTEQEGQGMFTYAGFNGDPSQLDIRYNVTVEEALAEAENLGL